MVKHKMLSSLELLNISKPRVTLILKEVVDNLIHISNNDDCKSLYDFKALCKRLKNMGVDDVSSFVSKSIIDYDINLNASSNVSLVDIKFIFNDRFPVNGIYIKNLRL